MDKQTVLITGHNGFTGRHAAQLLRSRGFNVVGLGGGANSEHPCDLTVKREVVECVRQLQPAYVLHLAGLAFVGHSNAEKFYNVNLFGTLNLLEALNDLPEKPKKIVISSSANIYGTPSSIEVIDETVVPAPVNHYAVSKIAMEYMVRTWLDRLPITVVRPFNYTGVGQSDNFLVPKIVGHFRRKEAIIELGNLDVSRDFSDVRDVVRAYADLLVSDSASDVFNVCSGQAYALRDVLHWASELAGYQMEVKVNPALVRINEIARLVGDNSKLVKQIGYQPKFSFAETIKSMFES